MIKSIVLKQKDETKNKQIYCSIGGDLHTSEIRTKAQLCTEDTDTNKRGDFPIKKHNFNASLKSQHGKFSQPEETFPDCKSFKQTYELEHWHFIGQQMFDREFLFQPALSSYIISIIRFQSLLCSFLVLKEMFLYQRKYTARRPRPCDVLLACTSAETGLASWTQEPSLPWTYHRSHDPRIAVRNLPDSRNSKQGKPRDIPINRGLEIVVVRNKGNRDCFKITVRPWLLRNHGETVIASKSLTVIVSKSRWESRYS